MNDSVYNSTVSNSTLAKCASFTEDDSTSVKAIKAVCYSVAMLISLLGNSAVIVIVAKYRRMRTTTNYLIANMAFSDLMMSAFAIPRQLTEIFIGPRRWLVKGTAGEVLCKFVYFLQDVSTAVSIQSIVVITVDRYAALVTPYKDPIITSRRRRLVIPLIWLISMGLNGNYFYTVRFAPNNNTTHCTFSWEPAFHNLQAQRIYFVFISVILIAVPLTAITVLYSLIFRSIIRQKTFPPTVPSLRMQRRKEDAKVIKKILAIIILFVICILPTDILGLLYLFAWHRNTPCEIGHVSFAFKFLFYSNASLNPCIYFLLNEKYRQHLRNVIKCRDFSNENQAPAYDMQPVNLK